MKSILNFFDKLEDHVRGRLSHYPIIYAIVGGIGIVLFWRGVWLTTDYIFETLAASQATMGSTISITPSITWWDGPLSFLIGLAILLMTGVFVSNFIGNEIIITGLRGEKKLTEKTEQEERMEVGAIGDIRRELRKVAEKLDAVELPPEKPKK
jgi:hypothetical protein